MYYRSIVALFRRAYHCGTCVFPARDFSSADPGGELIPGGYRLGSYYAPDGFSYGRNPPE